MQNVSVLLLLKSATCQLIFTVFGTHAQQEICKQFIVNVETNVELSTVSAWLPADAHTIFIVDVCYAVNPARFVSQQSVLDVCVCIC